MATMAPMVISAIISAGAAAKTASDQKKFASASQQQQQNAKMQQVNVKLAADERKRKEVLTQQQATQRARFSGLGIGSSGGSAGAVLEGLTKRSAAAGADRAALQAAASPVKASANLLSKKSAAFEKNMALLIGQK
ncbi:MAG: hypothetical protein JKY17_00580 [Magnetovibrio sp.]|nr:hypothetical protein [Magnetovibrio sp.]